MGEPPALESLPLAFPGAGWGRQGGTKAHQMGAFQSVPAQARLRQRRWPKTGHVPFRYYAMMVGLISGGLGMIGIGQGLRLLLLLVGKP